MTPRPPLSTLFPYTTLFRSHILPTSSVRPDCGRRRVSRLPAAALGVIGDGCPSTVRRHRRTVEGDRKSTRLNSSHLGISYAVFCLKKKNSYCIRRLRTAAAG